jgi:uncharacterized damage-inducible protein DinB
MYTSDVLIDIHERAHRNRIGLMEHCRSLTEEELNRELPEYGDPTVRLQLHHELTAARYWIGVIHGRILADDDNAAFPTVASLEALRREVFEGTERYLRGASPEELSRPRTMKTWDGSERQLVPAHIVVRTVVHLYHHQGKILAMCRLMGKPKTGFDYPLV